MKGYRVGIAGATGAVGLELYALLKERGFPVKSLRLMASSRSAGRILNHIVVEDLEKADPRGLDIVFFSAGAKRSLSHGPAFADAGAWVIDNSSAFRQDPKTALAIPEINGEVLSTTQNRIIANPNCSTIIALLPLAALHKAFGINRALLTTFQAVSGAGASALRELDDQTVKAAKGQKIEPNVFPKKIIHNLIPWIGDTDESGFCQEERKVPLESRKILSLPELKISATTVRTPVRRCHSISIWVRLNKRISQINMEELFQDADGIALSTTPPCPNGLEGADDVHVGRIRQDPDDNQAWWLWAVSDQIRKGAALNAIQIAEELIRCKRI